MTPLTPSQLEQARLSLLRYMRDNPARFGLATALLRSFLAAEGIRLEVYQVEQELEYLKDKGYVESPAKSISPELRTWRINANGRDYLAQQP
jgi:hypothetical protein